jgi:phenylalanyl-tRNA synthetase alpha chain
MANVAAEVAGEIARLGAAHAELKPLADLPERARAAFAAGKTELELRTELAKFVGKKGELQAAMSLMKQLAPADRPKLGAVVNAIKVQVEAEFDARLRDLAQKALDAELNARPYDLTLPGRLSLGRGHEHPELRVREELLAIFRDLGFVSVDGPEIELEENNFTKLAFPPDHPATDMQDSFWLGPGVLLRTHTSNVQSREMSRGKPPMAVVSAGAVYRRDDDVTHSPMFHQIEGFLIGENVSLAHLRGVLSAFAERLYGPGTPTRFRPSYFPFVEPGAEVDVGCVFCRPDDGSRERCRVCKATGWLEVGGCGMVHPDVFRHAGLDPETTTGFAFGIGVERIAMLRYGIPNIRVLFENDPRFLAQF